MSRRWTRGPGTTSSPCCRGRNASKSSPGWSGTRTDGSSRPQGVPGYGSGSFLRGSRAKSHKNSKPWCLYFGTGRKPSLLPFSGGGGSDTLYSTKTGRKSKMTEQSPQRTALITGASRGQGTRERQAAGDARDETADRRDSVARERDEQAAARDPKLRLSELPISLSIRLRSRTATR